MDYILVPIGGGGLITGVATLAKMLNPKIQVIGVEPREAASMTAALKAGEVVELPSANTIADGTAVKAVGKQNLPYVQKYVDQILLVDDDELVGAFLDMVENHKMNRRKFRTPFCGSIKTAGFERQKSGLRVKRRKYGCDHHVFYRTAWIDPERPYFLGCSASSGQAGRTGKSGIDHCKRKRKCHQTGT